MNNNIIPILFNIYKTSRFMALAPLIHLKFLLEKIFRKYFMIDKKTAYSFIN